MALTGTSHFGFEIFLFSFTKRPFQLGDEDAYP